MKQIGHLENGNILLECSGTEYRALNALAEVAAGKGLPMALRDDRHLLDTDLAVALDAVREWCYVKDRGNSLRELANDIDAAIGVKEKRA